MGRLPRCQLGVCCRLGLLAAVLGSGDIHLLPVPDPTALDPACPPCADEACAFVRSLADLSRLLPALTLSRTGRLDHLQSLGAPDRACAYSPHNAYGKPVILSLADFK